MSSPSDLEYLNDQHVPNVFFYVDPENDCKMLKSKSIESSLTICGLQENHNNEKSFKNSNIATNVTELRVVKLSTLSWDSDGTLVIFA